MTAILYPAGQSPNTAASLPAPLNLAPNGGVSQMASGVATSGWTGTGGSGTAAAYANSTNATYLHGADASSLAITVTGYGSGDITNPANPSNLTYYAVGGSAPANAYGSIPFTIVPGNILKSTVYVKSASGTVPVWLFARDSGANFYRHVGSAIVNAVSTGWTALTITSPGIPGADGTCAPSLFLAVGIGTVYISSLTVFNVTASGNTIPLASGPISNILFGMHVNENGTTPATAANYPSGVNWPPATMNYGLQRTWDCAGTAWKFIETANGVYNSTYLGNLDALMRAAYARGTKVLYTCGYTPTWSGTYFTSPPGGVSGNGNSDLTNFLVTLMTRYSASGAVPCPGTFAYIECWNEWDQNQQNTNGWGGTVAQMAAMANAIYTAVASANVSLGTSTNVVAPNVTYLGHGYFESFLAQYTAAYGTVPFPVFGYHLYPTASPEIDIVYASALLANMAAHGVSHSQLIMSEGCYSVASPTLDQARAFVTIPFLMYALFGVTAGIWYMYYISTSSFEALASLDGNGNSNQITPAGTAFATFTTWLVNATFTGYSVNPDGTWIVGLILSNGTPSHLVWNISGGGVLNIPPSWGALTYNDLGGGSTAISGSQVSLTRAPLLIK